MYCPRCGTQNEPGDRFCSSCGATLGEISSAPERRSLRERGRRLLGTTRKARMISAGTAIAIVVAIVAFVALKPSDDGSIPRDEYTIAADQLCVSSKRQIVATEGRSLRHPSGGDPGGFSALVPVVSNWRSEFEAIPVPTDRLDEAHALAVALREVEIQISELALVASAGNRGRTVARAEEVDTVTSRVEKALVSLNLAECAGATIGFPRPPAN